MIGILHFLDPELSGGYAIGVGKKDDLIAGFFDAHAQRVFFTWDADGIVFEIDNMQSFEGLFEFVEKKAGVILAVMVDDDHFVGRRIALDERSGEMGDEAGGFVAGADDDAYGVLLGMFFGRGRIESQPSEEPAIVE